jgi:aminopeptidase N
MVPDYLLASCGLIKVKLFLSIITALLSGVTSGQTANTLNFTRADTMRGSITIERAWWDVVSYRIGLAPDFNNKSIEGKTDITFRVLKSGSRMQIDLQQPMEISRAYTKGQQLEFTRDGNVYYIIFPQALQAGTLQNITLVFHGKPRIAERPPWDAGWIFTTDKSGRPWMSVTCQGQGASVWFPCKDHQGDEPDSTFINIAIPDTLVAVANGRFTGKQSFHPGMMTWRWEVRNPINNYNIIPYIGKYENWEESYQGEKGKLDCSYWVMDYNIDKAKKQFKQVIPMLKCFEHWFGPYPFYEDGFKLVESPHLGMEHQSAVAYGNGYDNGYLGKDLSQSGWGLKWDFIIIHESGHEWFGNNITTKDIADMWVHEGFTNYSETIFTTCEYGVEAGNDYVIGTRKLIKNEQPVIGMYGVNHEGSGDMYYKGGNMLHTIRQIINNDEQFRSMLRGLNHVFYHQTVTSKQVEDYISKQSGHNFSKVFDQYLRTTQVPRLQYTISGKELKYRWVNCVAGFDMTVKIKTGNNDYQWIRPRTSWTILMLKNPTDSLQVDRNFYVEIEQVK